MQSRRNRKSKKNVETKNQTKFENQKNDFSKITSEDQNDFEIPVFMNQNGRVKIVESVKYKYKYIEDNGSEIVNNKNKAELVKDSEDKAKKNEEIKNKENESYSVGKYVILIFVVFALAVSIVIYLNK